MLCGIDDPLKPGDECVGGLIRGFLDDFVELVIPILQERGLFRHEYEGSTLREHLGLPRPQSRYKDPAYVSAAS